MKLSQKFERGVAQPGLARPSGGREVAGSNPVAPTIKYEFKYKYFLHNLWIN